VISGAGVAVSNTPWIWQRRLNPLGELARDCPAQMEATRLKQCESGYLFERRMDRIGRRLGVLLLGTVLLAAFSVHAQPYPNHPIKIIVPYAAGGAVDIVARTIGAPLAEALAQPVIVDNRPGASANIGMEMAAKSPPDGYVLLMASNGIATNMALFPHLAFDGRRDFAPIAKIGYAPLVIVVPASSPAKSLKDLIAMAKAEPGKLTYASAGNGSSGHLAGELLKATAKIDVLHVPYKGGAPAITDLLGERISFMPINPVEVIAHIRGGRLRALAVASDRRLPLLPDVPTVAEAGLTGYEASVWWGLVAPANTSPEIVRTLNAETNKALANPAIANKLGDLGVVVTRGAPDQFGAFIKSQTELWSNLIKAARIQPD
jgi:tripartite-type tricarboxylate transporter receptor subunit TctC